MLSGVFGLVDRDHVQAARLVGGEVGKYESRSDP